MSRKEGGRELASIEDSVDALTQGLQKCMKKSKEKLIIATRNSKDSIMINRQQLENRYRKKNNSVDISSD